MLLGILVYMLERGTGKCFLILFKLLLLLNIFIVDV